MEGKKEKQSKRRKILGRSAGRMNQKGNGKSEKTITNRK